MCIRDSGNFGLEDGDYVGLPTADDSWNFKTFTKDEYEALKLSLIHISQEQVEQAAGSLYSAASTVLDAILGASGN